MNIRILPIGEIIADVKRISVRSKELSVQDSFGKEHFFDLKKGATTKMMQNFLSSIDFNNISSSDVIDIPLSTNHLLMDDMLEAAGDKESWAIEVTLEPTVFYISYSSATVSHYLCHVGQKLITVGIDKPEGVNSDCYVIPYVGGYLAVLVSCCKLIEPTNKTPISRIKTSKPVAAK